jgi:hypothetical protein
MSARDIVERQFTTPDGTNVLGPWRNIGEFHGLGGQSAAVDYMERQPVTYRHPARYRILRVDEVARLTYPGKD